MISIIRNLFGALFFILLVPSISIAQNIYETEFEARADLTIYISKYLSRADLLVKEVEYHHQAKGNTGKWYYVEQESEADLTVFFSEYESRSDLSIAYTKYSSRAGWKEPDKKHFLDKCLNSD